MSTAQPRPPDEGSTPPAPPASPSATIHEAELVSGPSGAVFRGGEIDFAMAVARRQKGENVVVGDSLQGNRRQAEQIEAAVGPYVRSTPHRELAGPRALPHFQQQVDSHEGHTFYETANLRATRRKP